MTLPDSAFHCLLSFRPIAVADPAKNKKLDRGSLKDCFGWCRQEIPRSIAVLSLRISITDYAVWIT